MSIFSASCDWICQKKNTMVYTQRGNDRSYFTNMLSPDRVPITPSFVNYVLGFINMNNIGIQKMLPMPKNLSMIIKIDRIARIIGHKYPIVKFIKTLLKEDKYFELPNESSL
jgi:hypothetical protein